MSQGKHCRPFGNIGRLGANLEGVEVRRTVRLCQPSREFLSTADYSNIYDGHSHTENDGRGTFSQL